MFVLLPTFGSYHIGALVAGTTSLVLSILCTALRLPTRLRLHALRAAWWERQINLANDASAQELRTLQVQYDSKVEQIRRAHLSTDGATVQAPSLRAQYFLNGKPEPLEGAALEADAPDWCVRTSDEITTRVLEVQKEHIVNEVHVIAKDVIERARQRENASQAHKNECISNVAAAVYTSAARMGSSSYPHASSPAAAARSVRV